MGGRVTTAKSQKKPAPRHNGTATAVSASSWSVLQQHRHKAATYPLNVLIWGPSYDASREYRARLYLRQKLKALGHDAQFSEELCTEPNALDDPMKDEHLQAASAHVIVMIYGSRGTQTERDYILTERDLAGKAIILIEKQLYERVKTRSLAGKNSGGNGPNCEDNCIQEIRATKRRG